MIGQAGAILNFTQTGFPGPKKPALFIAYGAPAIALLVYLFYWLLYLYGPHEAYLALLRGLGILVWPYPFLDLESVLRAIDCARHGIDVTLPNACMVGGAFQYSPLVLKAAALPLSAGQRVPLGLALDGLFLLSLFTLPRPRCWSEFWLLLLAALSSSTLYALERANIDVAIYLLVLAAVQLLLRGPRARLAGYATLLGAAAIKFYPASLMVLAAYERPRRFGAIALISLAAALLLVISFSSGLDHVVARLPQGTPFHDMFSASRLPLGLALLANGRYGDHAIGLITRIVSTIFLIGICAMLVRRLVPMILPDFRALTLRERFLLVAGSVSIAFCFFAAENVHYREIFLILTLPGLWALERGAKERAFGERFRFTSWVVIGLLWSEFFREGSERLSTAWLGGQAMLAIQLDVWVVRELFWWWLVSVLVSITICFLWDAPVLARLRRPVAVLNSPNQPI